MSLRDSRREISAARRALGAPADEITPLDRTRPRPPVEPQPTRKYTRRGYRAADGCELYEATGGCGQIAVRSYKEPVTHALDVADIAGRTNNQKQGQIWSMFPNLDAALSAAQKLREEGLTVTVVEARPYAGQPGDADVPLRGEK